MPRRARVVVTELPHHITHRGNNKENVFGDDNDRRLYLKFVADNAQAYNLDIWSYCLMPNHVHFIGVPHDVTGLANMVRDTQSVYTQYFNKKYGRVGHLWQGRFFSCALDAPHAYLAIRYVENNPVRAGLAATPDQYPWSSACSRCEGTPDPVLRGNCPFADSIPDWRVFLGVGTNDYDLLRQNTRKSLPLGSTEFLQEYSLKSGLPVHRNPVGRPRKNK